MEKSGKKRWIKLEKPCAWWNAALRKTRQARLLFVSEL